MRNYAERRTAVISRVINATQRARAIGVDGGGRVINAVSVARIGVPYPPLPSPLSHPPPPACILAETSRVAPSSGV